MMKRFGTWITALSVFAAGACQDATELTAPEIAPPLQDIAQGGSGGSSADFTFLPPLVPAPAVSGAFDASQTPTVLVCELNGSQCAAGPYVAGFLMTTGRSRIQVDAAQEMYWVNWQTGGFNLNPDKNYRLRTYAGGREVGHVDLDVVRTQSEAANVDRNNFAPLVLGSTLPIRFRFVNRIQPPAQGTIRGRVIDAVTEAPLGGALVDLGAGRTATSGQDGTFSLAAAPETYSGSVSRTGYQSATLSDVEVRANETTDLGDIPLQPLQVGSLTLRNDTVGGGLQIPVQLMMAAGHGGVTVRIASSDPGKVLLSPNAGTAGAASIDVAVPADATTRTFWVQGAEGATTTAILTATAQGFGPGTATITVVRPELRFVDLPGDINVDAPNLPFRVRVGIPEADGGLELQAARSGGSGFPVSIASSAAGVARLATSSAAAGSVTIRIPEQQFTSASTVAAGGVAIDALTPGATTITATSSAGAASASQNVTVSGGAITVRNDTVGGGLQRGTALVLPTAGHGGVTVRIESSDPSKVLLAPNTTTAGAAAIEIPVTNGISNVNFVVQGVEGTTGTATITATATGFGPGTGTITIVKPAFRVVDLPADADADAPNLPFRVQIGIQTPGGVVIGGQAVRRGGGGFPVTLTSSNATAARLATSSTSGTPVTVQIAEGQFGTASTVAQGGVALDPLAVGTTTITASSSAGATPASQAVTISGGAIIVPNVTLGSGLETQQVSKLPTGGHGGVTVRVQSSNPSKVLLRAGGSNTPVAFLDIPVSNGSVNIVYWVQALEGQTGDVAITAAATGFGQGNGTAKVVQPGLEVINLPGSTTTLSDNDAFFVRIGVPREDVLLQQQARIGGPTKIVTVTSSNPAVAQLVSIPKAGGTTQTGATVTARILPGWTDSSPDARLEIDPLSAGSTVVSATIPGFVPTNFATRTVTVTAGSTWSEHAVQHRGKVGQRFTITCTPNGTARTVWGTDTYTDDSSICTAAVHAGKISFASGGTVTYEMRAGQASYAGTTRNGVTTASYGAWHGSFIFP